MVEEPRLLQAGARRDDSSEPMVEEPRLLQAGARRQERAPTFSADTQIIAADPVASEEESCAVSHVEESEERGEEEAEPETRVRQRRNRCMSTPGNPFRGVSVHHLRHDLLPAVAAAGLPAEATVYQVEPAVIRPAGEGVVCPRDGRPGAAYIDAVHGPDHVGDATHMLSYAWFYAMDDIVSALEVFCQHQGLEAKEVYVWMCCLCINQHRVQEESQNGREVSFEHFSAEFRRRVEGIGHVLALMSPWESPYYLRRVWCIYELFTAVSMQGQCEVTVLMPKREEGRFCDVLMREAEDTNALWEALNSSVHVENAEASVQRDRDGIMRLIVDGPGYQAVNAEVAKYLTGWVANASEGQLKGKLESLEPDVESLAIMSAQVGRLLRIFGMYERSMAVLAEGSRRMTAAGLSDCPTHARLLTEMSAVHKKKGRHPEAVEALEQARGVRERTGTMHSVLGGRLLNNLGREKEAAGDLDGAVSVYEQARHILEETESMQTRDGAQLHRNLGLVKERLGDLPAALKDYRLARQTLDSIGLLRTPDGARILNNLGAALCEQDDLEASDQALSEAKAIREQTGTMDTAAGGDLLVSLGKLRQRQGNKEQANLDFRRASTIFRTSGTKSTRATRADSASENFSPTR